MNHDKQKQVEEIYHEALELSQDKREKFLNEIGEEEMRREVESLLAFESDEDSFIDNPLKSFVNDIWDNKGDATKEIIGKVIGQYKIISMLGAGGMGEVYLAEDTVLSRQVAIKILPKHFTENTERLQRFEREAKSISSLNHPSIVTIHQIGNEENLHFIVTEFIEGENLREYVLRNKPNIEKILDILLQLTSALESAHSNGIIHRDIKPENIMVRPDGFVKILDFGVAKLAERTEKQTTDNLSFKTAPGRIIGTKSYMSPEQSLGKRTDERSDIFSFGTVLYEMVTGSLPFSGDSDAAFFDSLLNQEPKSFDTFDEDIPQELEIISKRALEKEPRLRYQTFSDLRVELLRFKRDINSGLTSGINQSFSDQSFAQQKTSWTNKFAIVSIFVVAILAVVYFAFIYKIANSNDSAQLQNLEFSQLTESSGRELFANLSPDGKSIIYTKTIDGFSHIFSQRVGGRNAVNLTKDSIFDNTQPAFSSDGEKIAFRAERDGGGIFVMGATGESVKRVTDSGYYPAWSPDGAEIVFCVTNFSTPVSRGGVPSPLYTINLNTNKKRLITKKDAVQPNWSPNGHRIAFWGINSGGQRDIWTVAANGNGEPVQVTNTASFDWNPIWSPDGKYLYFASDRSGSMNFWRVAIEEKTGKITGNPKAIVIPSAYAQHLSFAKNGNHFAYVSLVQDKNIHRIEFDSKQDTVKGESIEITKGSKSSTIPDISPDGEWIVFSTFGDKQEDIYITRNDGRGLRKLTDDVYKDRIPRWSPNGKQIIFFSDRTGSYETWKINADGSGLKQVTQLNKSRYAQTSIWSPNGKKTLINTNADFPLVIDSEKSWANQKPVNLPKDENPKLWVLIYDWSPDGKTLVGHQRRSDRSISGIVEYSFDEKKYTHLTDFGDAPIYLNDSRRALFIHENKIYLLDTQTKRTKEILSAGNNLFDSVAISKDNKYIYYSVEKIESDVWLAKFE